MGAWIMQEFATVGNWLCSLAEHEREVCEAVLAERADALRMQLRLSRDAWIDFPGMAIESEPTGTVELPDYGVTLTLPLVDAGDLMLRLDSALDRLAALSPPSRVIIVGFSRTLVLWPEEAKAVHAALKPRIPEFKAAYQAFDEKWRKTNGIT